MHVLPSGLEARVRAIHAQNRPAEAGIAGQRCALNLAGAEIAKEAIHRGDWVRRSGDAGRRPTRLDATLPPARERAAAARATGRRSTSTSRRAMCRLAIALLQDEPIRPGERGRIQLVLDRPIAALWGDRFVLRDTSARRTMGGGVVLDLRAPRRRRRTPERLAVLGAVEEEQAAGALRRLLAQPPGWIDFSAFVEDRNLAPPQQEALIEQLGLVRLRAGEGEVAMAAAGWTGLRARLRDPSRPFTASSRTAPAYPPNGSAR